MRFALAGNQNCGKTTLFNALTGSNQHVGNFPGVTVEQKVGDIKGQKNCTVVDLPGIYSLRPYTQEEIVTRDYIINEKPDGIINIVDATNIERNLYLTLQLLELRVPMVLALNMMDEVRANGGTIDVKMMSDALGIPVIPVSAAKGEGISDLIDKAVETARNKTKPVVTDFCSDDSAVHRCIHAVVHLIMDHANRAGIPPRFCASKLIEGDKNIEDQLELNQNELELLEHCIVEMEDESKLDRNAALADMRYDFIEKVVAISVAVRTIGAVLSVCSILAVGSVLAVKTFQNRKIIQVQPYFIADIAPLQGVFAYTKLRCLSVCSVCAFLPGGACDVGYRHKVLPLIAFVTPLYVGFSSLHLYVFGVNAVSAVGSVFTVGTVNSILAVFSIGSVFTVNSVNAVFSVCAVYSVLTVGAVNAVLAVGAVNAVFSVCAVYSVLTVGTIRAVFTACAVLSVFSGSAPQLGKRHKVVPVGFVAVFPLNRRAVVSHLRQCVACFCRLAPSYCKHAAKHQKSGAKRKKCTCE